MRVGIVVANDPWRFLHDVYEDLDSRYTVGVFKPRLVKSPVFYYRINKALFQHDLQSFINRHDVLFFEWASEYLIAASRLPKTRPIVTRLHRYEMFKWVHDVNWDAVDRVILVSHAMRRQFEARFPSHVHKTVVIPVGVPVDKFRPDERAFDGTIGTLCYLTPRKRVYELILAFQQILQQRDGLSLRIGGARHHEHGDYYDAMMRLIAGLNLRSSVVFDGDVAEPPDWYRKVDIFVSNSYSEGAQVALMEAMAAGRYCLSHHWDGAEELLPDDYLFLTDSELTTKVLRYCDEPDHIRRQHQEKLREIARERFDIEGVKARIRKVLEDAADTNRSLRT